MNKVWRGCAVAPDVDGIQINKIDGPCRASGFQTEWLTRYEYNAVSKRGDDGAFCLLATQSQPGLFPLIR